MQGTQILEARRFAGLCAIAFVLMFGYSISGRAARSLFLEHFSSAGLPSVWIAVAVAATVVVAFYNRYSARVPLSRLFAVVAGVSAALLVALLGLYAWQPRWGSFGLEVWKDVHIVVLVEVFWSFANSVYPIGTARKTYGLFLSAGALGGISGNLAIGELVRFVGTSPALWLVLPTLLVSGAGSYALLRVQNVGATPRAKPAATLEGFRVVLQSRYLVLLLLLVGVVQFVITLVDYQYSAALQASFPATDLRTRMDSRVHAAIDLGQIVLQLSAGTVLRLLGVPLTLLGIPLLLGLTLGGYLFVPVFATMAAAKVASKALDYSLFRAAKEILYIPLDYAEKTQGKAVIDMLTYRVAKGGVSFLLLALGALQGGGALVTGLLLGLVGVWVALTAAIGKMFRGATHAEPAPQQPARVESA